MLISMHSCHSSIYSNLNYISLDIHIEFIFVLLTRSLTRLCLDLQTTSWPLLTLESHSYNNVITNYYYTRVWCSSLGNYMELPSIIFNKVTFYIDSSKQLWCRSKRNGRLQFVCNIHPHCTCIDESANHKSKNTYAMC